MKRVAKISRWVKEPTKAEKIAECESNMAWFTARAAEWLHAGNVIEHERCMRLVNRAFEDLGRVQAGLI